MQRPKLTGGVTAALAVACQRETVYLRTRALANRGSHTVDENVTLEEIDRDIAIVRDNLRQLTEQAAAFSGARDEELAADRISEQEARLAPI